MFVAKILMLSTGFLLRGPTLGLQWPHRSVTNIHSNDQTDPFAENSLLRVGPKAMA
jgi:hypothetical protein